MLPACSLVLDCFLAGKGILFARGKLPAALVEHRKLIWRPSVFLKAWPCGFSTFHSQEDKNGETSDKCPSSSPEAGLVISRGSLSGSRFAEVGAALLATGLPERRAGGTPPRAQELLVPRRRRCDLLKPALRVVPEP